MYKYHLLFGIVHCYIYLLYVVCFANKCQIGCLDVIEHLQLYLLKKHEQ